MTMTGSEFAKQAVASLIDIQTELTANQGTSLTAHEATQLWMEANRLTKVLQMVKTVAQDRDWKDKYYDNV